MSIDAMIKCARREQAMRERVYPRLVAAGKLTEEKAADEIATMAAIVDTLQHLKDGQRLPGL